MKQEADSKDKRLEIGNAVVLCGIYYMQRAVIFVQ